GSHGRFRTEPLNKGDVAYIPQGFGHSIENAGPHPCRVLIGFNTGRYEAIDLSQWIAGNPLEILASNFGQPPSVVEKFPRQRVSITPWARRGAANCPTRAMRCDSFRCAKTRPLVCARRVFAAQTSHFIVNAALPPIRFISVSI